jgi:AcrR family transcriptional regulator
MNGISMTAAPDKDTTQTAERAPRKSSRRADRVREIILDVALDCFSSSGFAGTSTRSIAKLAGVQHSLVNYHFESKEKLWIAMMDKVLGRHIEGVYKVLEEAKDQPASEQLRLFIEAYAKTAAAAPHVFRILTQHSTQNSTRMDWLLDTYLRKQFAFITGIITEAQAEGQVIEGAPEHIFYLLVGGVGIFFAAPREYALLTGKDPASAAEMHKLIDFLCSVIFVKKR